MFNAYTPTTRSPIFEGWDELSSVKEIRDVEESENHLRELSGPENTEKEKTEAYVAFIQAIAEWKLYALFSREGTKDPQRQLEAYVKFPKRGGSKSWSGAEQRVSLLLYVNRAIRACTLHAKGCEVAFEYDKKYFGSATQPFQKTEASELLRVARLKEALPSTLWGAVNRVNPFVK